MFSFHHTLEGLLAPKAEEERQVIQIMTLFPAYYRHYKVRPTFEQFKEFTDAAQSRGYGLNQLYEVFASGSLPAELDALIKRLAEYWRPAGEIIESELAQRRIE